MDRLVCFYRVSRARIIRRRRGTAMGVAAAARSADGGQIIVGHMLLAINGKDMSSSSTRSLERAEAASRPVTLTFVFPSQRRR